MTRPPLSQPPPDASWPLPPEGFREEWRPDSDWRLATAEEKIFKRCRRPGCCRTPAAGMLRSHERDVLTWWLYCDWHLYARRIEGGRVEMRYLVPEEG